MLFRFYGRQFPKRMAFYEQAPTRREWSERWIQFNSPKNIDVKHINQFILWSVCLCVAD